MKWIQENAGNIVVIFILVAAVANIIRGIFIEKKKANASGHSYCTIGCPGCQGDCYQFDDEELKKMDIDAMRKAIEEKTAAKKAAEAKEAS